MILVTGGYGCIGAELIKWLLSTTDQSVVLASRQIDATRTDRVFHGIDTARLECVELDVSDFNALSSLFQQRPFTHVAHLAALQTPDCNQHRDLGLQVNLAATQKLVEVIKLHGRERCQRFVYASSIAVYGPRASYASSRVPMLAEPNPVNVYGVWKLASEHVAKLFSSETGIPTVSLRPAVLFGPGRDAGLTSTPTTAMKAVALGVPYEIPFDTKQDYLYAPDVGAAFGLALTAPFDGYGAFTLPAITVAMPELVAILREAAGQVGLAQNFAITHGDQEVPFICELEFAPMIDAFPDTPRTDFKQALVQSLSVFRDQAQRGWLTQDTL